MSVRYAKVYSPLDGRVFRADDKMTVAEIARRTGAVAVAELDSRGYIMPSKPLLTDMQTLEPDHHYRLCFRTSCSHTC